MEPKTKKIARPKFLVFDEAQIDSSILFNNTKQYSPYVQFDIQILFHWGNFNHPLPSRTGSDGIICSASRTSKVVNKQLQQLSLGGLTL
jgi:hypothetical protein